MDCFRIDLYMWPDTEMDSYFDDFSSFRNIWETSVSRCSEPGTRHGNSISESIIKIFRLCYCGWSQRLPHAEKRCRHVRLTIYMKISFLYSGQIRAQFDIFTSGEALKQANLATAIAFPVGRVPLLLRDGTSICISLEYKFTYLHECGKSQKPLSG